MRGPVLMGQPSHRMPCSGDIEEHAHPASWPPVSQFRPVSWPKVGPMRARPLRQKLSHLNRSSLGRVRIDHEGGRLPVRADETFGSDCCLSMFPDSLGDGGNEL
jgi:hypothetical protein